MLLRCDIAGRKTAYRPRFLGREQDAIHLSGLLPLRIGALVEVAQRGATSDAPERARVARCVCSPDGLYLIDLEVVSD